MALTARPLTTERLELRPVVVTDLDDIWAYQRLSEVGRHMLWTPDDRGQSRAVVRQMAAETVLEKDGDSLSFAVRLAGYRPVIGHVELVWRSVEHQQGEIGYVFDPAYQGRGFATEAARALLRLGFDELGLHRITARCSALNTASAGLMTRLGMRQEARFVENRKVGGVWREELVFAILLREWSGEHR